MRKAYEQQMEVELPDIDTPFFHGMEEEEKELPPPLPQLEALVSLGKPSWNGVKMDEDLPPVETFGSTTLAGTLPS